MYLDSPHLCSQAKSFGCEGVRTEVPDSRAEPSGRPSHCSRPSRRTLWIDGSRLYGDVNPVRIGRALLLAASKLHARVRKRRVAKKGALPCCLYTAHATLPQHPLTPVPHPGSQEKLHLIVRLPLRPKKGLHPRLSTRRSHFTCTVGTSSPPATPSKDSYTLRKLTVLCNVCFSWLCE